MNRGQCWFLCGKVVRPIKNCVVSIGIHDPLERAGAVEVVVLMPGQSRDELVAADRVVVVTEIGQTVEFGQVKQGVGTVCRARPGYQPVSSEITGVCTRPASRRAVSREGGRIVVEHAEALTSIVENVPRDCAPPGRGAAGHTS